MKASLPWDSPVSSLPSGATKTVGKWEAIDKKGDSPLGIAAPTPFSSEQTTQKAFQFKKIFMQFPAQ